jgi:hypothetical protein
MLCPVFAFHPPFPLVTSNTEPLTSSSRVPRCFSAGLTFNCQSEIPTWSGLLTLNSCCVRKFRSEASLLTYNSKLTA